MRKLPVKYKEETVRKAAIAVFLFAATFVFMMQSPLNIWLQNGNSGTDSSVFRTIGYYMHKGLMPYRDLFDHKGPLIYIYNWLGVAIRYKRGIWIIEFISLLVCVAFIYKIARLVCGRLYSCLAVLVTMAPLYTYFQEGDLVEEYAMPFIAVALYIFIDYFLNENINRFRLAVCGFSFAAVCLLRINMVSVWAVFCPAVLLQCIWQKNGKRVLSFLLWFLAGAAVITIPILVWLAVNGAFSDFIYDYFVFNTMYVNKIDEGEKLRTLMRYFSLVYYLNTPYILVSTVIAIYLGWRRKDLFHVSYIAAVFVTLISIGLSARRYDHYGMVLVPVIVYPIANLFAEAEGNEKKLFGGLAMYMLVILALPTWINNGLNRTLNCYYDKYNTLPREGAVEDIGRFILANTDENDKITVWGNWNAVYVLTQRLSASKYTYQHPIGEVDESIIDEYFEELQENMPKIIVIEQYQDLNEMEEFIRVNHYELVKESYDAKVYMVTSSSF